MVCPRNPNSSVFFKLLSTCLLYTSDAARCSTFIPIALVHTNNLSGMKTYPTIGKEIWRVCKYHIKLKIKLREHIKTVTMDNGEVSTI